MPKKNDDYAVFFGVLIFAAGITIFIYQIFCYFKYGFLPILSPISWLKWIDNTWAVNPQSWKTLHKILSYIPSSILLIVIGVCLNNTSD